MLPTRHVRVGQMKPGRGQVLAYLLALSGVVVLGHALSWPVPAVLAAVAVLGSGLWWAVPDRPAPVPPGGEAPLPSGFGRALLEQMPAALIVVAGNERLTYANPAALRLFPSARPGRHYSTLIRTPDFVEALDTILRERSARDFRFTMAAPSPRTFEARAALLPEGVARDFGEGLQVILQVEDRTQAKALLDTRTDFIANASHELRTPLASILGYIETLQGHARDDPNAREMFLDIMLQQATRMKRLVDDLMSLSRIELSAHMRPDTVVDLYEVAAEAASALYPLASDNDVLLQVELDPDGPQVLGDRDQLHQVVVNLVDNAIKYGGSGKKVRVLAAEPDPRHPGMVGIAVADQGPGIAREHIPRLTERFYRVSAAQSKDKGGTGLGLAITKHILARHGGALDIRSAPGDGSRFVIWVPEMVATESDFVK